MLIGACGVLALVACSDDGDKKTDGGTTGGSFKLGMIVPVSGPDENLGKGQKQCAELAAAEINAAGGVLDGLKIEFEIFDEEDSGLEDKVKTLVADTGVMGIAGPAFSSTSQMVLGHMGAKMAAISPSATSPALSTPDTFYRTAPSDAVGGYAAAQYAYEELGAKKASIVYRDDTYGQSLNEKFAEKFKELGGTILAQVAYPEEDDYASYDFTKEVADVFADAPEVVYMVTFGQDGVKFLSAVKGDTGYDAVKDTVKFMGCDGQTTADFASGADPSVIGDKFFGALPGPPPSDPNYTKFAAAYKAKYTQDPVALSEGLYDAVYLLAYAAERVGKADDAAAIAAAIKDVAGPGDTKINVAEWAKGKEAAKAGAIDYEGCSGVLNFDANGDPDANYLIYTIKNGAVEIIKEKYPEE